MLQLWSACRRLPRVAALFAALSLTESAPGGELPAAGVLVLRNGNVLQGAVTPAGDHFLIGQGGASLQVPAAQVELACASLNEAYELRRQNRVGAAADSHLELARWCLGLGLIDQAAREVLDARTKDAGNPGIALLDVQIGDALLAEASRRDRAADIDSAQTGPADVAGTAVMAPALLNPPMEAQAQFVRSIQPMLVQNCATGGCHQNGSNQQMRLDRWALEGNGNPQLIRRNLDAVLAQVNAEDPPSSPLIVRARRPHGLRRDALSKPLATYQAGLLMNWLNTAAGVAPAPEGEETDPEGSVNPAELKEANDEAIAPEKHKSEQATRTEFVPRDAFDADIFNRQARPRAVALAEATQEPSQADIDMPETLEASATASPAE